RSAIGPRNRRREQLEGRARACGGLARQLRPLPFHSTSNRDAHVLAFPLNDSGNNDCRTIWEPAGRGRAAATPAARERTTNCHDGESPGPSTRTGLRATFNPENRLLY